MLKPFLVLVLSGSDFGACDGPDPAKSRSIVDSRRSFIPGVTGLPLQSHTHASVAVNVGQHQHGVIWRTGEWLIVGGIHDR